jgi:hypothetical protein
LAGPAIARGGMPSPLPADVARTLRLTESTSATLQAISFFVVVLLLSAVVVRWLWNGVARDVTWLPRLTFGRSLSLIAIWGLFFLVVLTMIAASRELMTPGTWEKEGLLYRLPTAEPVAHGSSDDGPEARPAEREASDGGTQDR